MTTLSTRLQVEALEQREVPAIIFGVTGSNRLVTFDSADPATLLRSTPIVGFLATGETITDIDVRPATGALIGRSNFDRLFLINPINTFAIPFGATVPIVGRPVGMDFDPRNTQLRIYSNLGENVVIDVVSGTLLRVDTPLSYRPGDSSQGAPRVTGLGFANSLPDTTSTTTGVFAIDHYRNTLVRPTVAAGLPSGILSTVGGLGINVGARAGFDIAPFTNTAFASFQINGLGISRLYTVNLGTGRARVIGPVGTGIVLNDIAVDLRNSAGFTSAAGFGALPPPGGSFSFGSGFGSSSSFFRASSQTTIAPDGSTVSFATGPLFGANSGTA